MITVCVVALELSQAHLIDALQAAGTDTAYVGPGWPVLCMMSNPPDDPPLPTVELAWTEGRADTWAVACCVHAALASRSWSKMTAPIRLPSHSARAR